MRQKAHLMTVTSTLWSVLVIMALVFVSPCVSPQWQRSVSSWIYFSRFLCKHWLSLCHTPRPVPRAACDQRKHTASPVCSPAHTPLLTHIVPGLGRAPCLCFFVKTPKQNPRCPERTSISCAYETARCPTSYSSCVRG